MTNTTSSIPHRVIIATTGMTEVVQSLCRNPLIRTAGIIDCRPTPHDCAHYAEQHHIAHCFYNGLEKLKSWISNLNPDLMIIYKMPFLLPEYIYNLPLFGTINIHPSLLPRYRGPNPWFWIYYNMESYSGITIHKINNFFLIISLLWLKHYVKMASGFWRRKQEGSCSCLLPLQWTYSFFLFVSSWLGTNSIFFIPLLTGLPPPFEIYSVGQGPRTMPRS